MDNHLETTFAELDAMKLVAEAIEPLNTEARNRVLTWATEHFDVTLRAPIESQNRLSDASLDATGKVTTYDSLGELFAASLPGSDAEKALVAGYWLQVVQGASDFGTESVNIELKHLGYGIGNITRAFDSLKSTRPQQVIQLRKSGTTKQARKKFKLTEVGVKAVETFIKDRGAS